MSFVSAPDADLEAEEFGVVETGAKASKIKFQIIPNGSSRSSSSINSSGSSGSSGSHQSVRRGRRSRAVKLGPCALVNLGLTVLHIIISAAIFFWARGAVTKLSGDVEALQNDGSELVEQTGIGSARLTSIEEQQDLLSNLFHGHESKEEYINEHHGIGKRYIAHIYGDSGQLDTCYKNSTCSQGSQQQMFTDAPSSLLRECGGSSERSTLRIRRSDQRDLWCTTGPRDGRRSDRVLLAGNSVPVTYNYFKQASWMEDGSTAANYDFLLKNRIRVKSSGMYIIQATVHFLSNNTIMRVTKREYNTANEIVLGSCFVQVDSDQSHSTDMGVQLSCSVFMVSMLSENDELFMDFSGNKFFWVRKDLLYMTVIKLNGYTIN